MLNRIVLVGAIALLGGCSSMYVAQGQPAEPAPVEYRALALDAVKKTFFDPYSVRDAEISAPAWKRSWNFDGDGWIVCVRGNAKNRMGGYIGISDTAYLIRGGAVVDNFDTPAEVGFYCGDLAYTPFTELDDLRNS